MPKRKVFSQQTPRPIKTKNFDPIAITAEIKALRQAKRPPQYKKTISKLYPLYAEIWELKKRGSSLEDIRIWLTKYEQIDITTGSISRFLKKMGTPQTHKHEPE